VCLAGPCSGSVSESEGTADGGAEVVTVGTGPRGALSSWMRDFELVLRLVGGAKDCGCEFSASVVREDSCPDVVAIVGAAPSRAEVADGFAAVSSSIVGTVGSERSAVPVSSETAMGQWFASCPYSRHL
jgi:hypothetical protein